jgi:S-adenosylmethionine/arginine decarboxylase-like enzyme
MQWQDCRQATEGLRNADTLKRLCLRLCEELRLKVAGNAFFQFSPGGVTGTLLLDGAHIAIHTWPERNMLKAEIDLRRQDSETTVLNFMERLKTCFLPLTSATEQGRRSVKVN